MQSSVLTHSSLSSKAQSLYTARQIVYIACESLTFWLVDMLAERINNNLFYTPIDNLATVLCIEFHSVADQRFDSFNE